MLLNYCANLSLKNFKCYNHIRYVYFSTNGKNPKSNKNKNSDLLGKTEKTIKKESLSLLESIINLQPDKKYNLPKSTYVGEQKSKPQIQNTRKVNIGNVLIHNEKKVPEINASEKSKKIKFENLFIGSDKKSSEMIKEKKRIPAMNASKKSKKINIESLLIESDRRSSEMNMEKEQIPEMNSSKKSKKIDFKNLKIVRKSSLLEKPKKIIFGNVLIHNEKKVTEMNASNKSKKINIENLFIGSDKKSFEMNKQKEQIPEMNASKKSEKIDFEALTIARKSRLKPGNKKSSKKHKGEKEMNSRKSWKINIENLFIGSDRRSSEMNMEKEQIPEMNASKKSEKINIESLLIESDRRSSEMNMEKEQIPEMNSSKKSKLINIESLLIGSDRKSFEMNKEKEQIPEMNASKESEKINIENLLIENDRKSFEMNKEREQIPEMNSSKKSKPIRKDFLVEATNQPSVKIKKPDIENILIEHSRSISINEHSGYFSEISQNKYLEDISIRSKDKATYYEDMSEKLKMKNSPTSEYLFSILHINSIFGNEPDSQRKEKKTEEDDLSEILKTLTFSRVNECKFDISETPSFILNYQLSNRLNIFSKQITQEKRNEESSRIIDTIESHEYRKLNRLLSFNSFQEAVFLTKDKKMWNFPIDNDQDSEELKVGFQEHVFPQQYLTGKLPTTGMVGQFMNYVCMGLSQNPHLTVSEKKAHIKWYEEYLSTKIEEIDMAMQKSIEDAKYEQELRNKR